MLEQAKILGVVVTYAIYLLCSLTFVARLLGRPQLGRWFGYPLMLAPLPLLYLLLLAGQLERPLLYYVQIGLMLLYLLAESLLDYVLKDRQSALAEALGALLEATAPIGQLIASGRRDLYRYREDEHDNHRYKTATRHT
jgi:hypothetical protein